MQENKGLLTDSNNQWCSRISW